MLSTKSLHHSGSKSFKRSHSMHSLEISFSRAKLLNEIADKLKANDEELK